MNILAPHCNCVRILVQGQTVTLPSWLPRRGWRIEQYSRSPGYVRYNSHNKTSGLRFNERLHRLVACRLLNRPLEPDEHVHHQDFNKLNNCPFNFIIVPRCLNPTPCHQDPFTGRMMSNWAWGNLHGNGCSDAPDWVTS